MNTCGNILIVNSEEYVQDMLREYFTDLGYHVLVAGGTGAALDILTSVTSPVVLVDLEQPDIDGLATVARLRRSRPDLRVIAMSGTPTLQSTISALRQGVFDYVVKPFRLEDLKDIVKRAVSSVGDDSRTLKLQRRIAELECYIRAHGLQPPPDPCASETDPDDPHESNMSATCAGRRA